jgi:ATP-dependent 26S proteasome regulatory subunit
MTELSVWQEENGRALSVALAWLRARLERPAEQGVDGDAAPRVGATDVVFPPALRLLAVQFGLSTFEQQVLLLCAAMELDTRIPALCAAAQGDGYKAYPTFGLAMMLFDEPAWDALSPQRPLRYWRLVEVVSSSSQPLTGSPLRVDERIASYLKGLNELDDCLSALVSGLDPSPDISLPGSQRQFVREICAAMARKGAPPIVQLTGADGASKRLISAAVARECGRRLLHIPAERLPLHIADIDATARLCRRESLLLPILWCLDGGDLDSGAGERPSAARQFLERCGIPLLFATREAWDRIGAPELRIEVLKPGRLEQEEAWREALNPPDDQLAKRLANQFNLDVQSIQETGSGPHAEVNGSSSRAIWNACRRRVRPRLDSLAQRITPQATWDDLVLPHEQTDLLRQIATQVTHRTTVYEEWELGRRIQRGLGISALFSGESGTGKTFAAEVLAHHLELDLYRIDLSAVVSKYIGETEKNLRRLFDAAEDGSCILFFDEADALFGKRTEVKDSHDRYANIEINYLLQRMESFRGLAILATNLRSTLDGAFVRRIRFIVTFPFPSAADRRRMWERVFPDVAPVVGLDHERLARFGLTGAAIRNVAVNAAFLAADETGLIEMRHVLRATRAEFAKLERPVNAAEFNDPSPLEAGR